jgi:hypothetical protein
MRKNKTKKDNKNINFELVPNAISRGIIEGYSHPYIEPTKIISEQICPIDNIDITNENDPISYNEKIPQGSGLNAIKLLRLKN